MNDLIAMLTFVSLVLSLIGVGGIYGVYKTFIKPRRTKTKLRNLLPLIQEWFDEIDVNLENELLLRKLNNKEKKINEYIETNLKGYFIKPNKKIKRKWNKKMGIKKELWDSDELFQEYSRVPAEGVKIESFLIMIFANFYKFFNEFNSESKNNCNFGDIEQPIKF